jgi:16S rRNA (guanine(966)-N(2))-methyltransferase RsmD
VRDENRPHPFDKPESGAIVPVSRNRVRIVGGAWRSRWIAFPASRDLRPTPDRVRETLFNWLGQDLTGSTCLDLFAGSGALGFEAASRGARRVVMVERDPAVFRALAESRDRLGAGTVELVKAEALEFLGTDDGVYDVIFLDPPYAAGYWPGIAPLLRQRLAPGGMVYHESGERPASVPGWEVRRQGRAGRVTYRLLNWNGKGS